MTDFSVSKAVTGVPVDTQWRAGKHGQDSARSGQLDPTAFTAGTHYNLGGRTDNVIPSGVAVAKLASGLYGPYDSTAGSAGDPRRKLAGFINDDEGIALGATPATAKPTFARLIHGVINPSLLPVVAQRTTLGAAEAVTGSYIYVED
ncbi:hypothetical protein [Microbacterium trichothecenolyticum]|uniref:Uncharacterized protein n=1 Tax=Microbacterium trichothecenolyticum TaxID=69370 RepID=A0A0M2H5V5_MICTR|nr:hypothetical protein [Microbacterium trichothecenolyticum]KJL39915.1 hypothetical protein RS82_04128 [Microbacterium trichothecenolyticum]